MDEDLWAAYDRMGLSFQEHAADSAFNAHYDRPAVLAALGPVTGRRVLDAACGPGLYLRDLLERGATVSAFDASRVMVALARQLILVAYSGLCGEAEFEACQVAGPPPVQRGAGPVSV